jgi:hypothetical protein
LRVRFARGLDLRACGAFEGGALRGRGEQVPLSKTPLRPWWSVTPQLRLQWFFARSWFVDADGGLVVPLRRESFVFEDPTTTFHEVPVLGSRWAIGLGYGLGGP